MPAATLTPLPTPHITQIPTPTANAAGLIILKRQIEHLQTGPLSFVTETGQKLDEAALQQGSQLSAETPDAAGYGLATEYQGSLLTAVQNFNHDYSQGWVTVAQDGRVIYQIYTGPASMIFSLYAGCTVLPRVLPAPGIGCWKQLLSIETRTTA